MKALWTLIIIQLIFPTPNLLAGGNIPYMFTPLANCPNFSQAFSFTGANQSFTVPVGCESITVKVWGAGGGGGGSDGSTGGSGGGSGYATSSIAVMGGETLTLVVGGGGGIGLRCAAGTGGGAGGFGGGAFGGNAGPSGCSGGGGGGGGASRILRGTTELTVAAGGAGGGGAGRRVPGAGGAGGVNGSNAANGAPGGITNASGNASGTAGANATGDGGGGGGGGGGRNGGTGGGHGGTGDNGGGGGGGGAGFVGASGVTGVTANGAGTVPANNTDPDYVNGIGVGGATTVAGGNGRIVISYVPPLPLTDSALTFWLDGKSFDNKFSDTGCTIPQTTNNGQVGCWRDRNANVNVIAPTNGNRPTLNADGSLLFTPGGASEMNTATQVLNGNLNDVVVFSIVSAINTTTCTPYNLNYPSNGCTTDPAAANNRYSLHFIYSGNIVYYDFGGCYNPRSTEALGAPQTNSIVTMSYQNSGATPQMLTRRNGTQILTRPVAVAANFNNGRIGLGDGLNNNSYMNGNIGEMIIITRPMTTADMESYEGYLACKWGLQGSLPAGHPFRNTCP